MIDVKDEKNRSKLWGINMIVSSALIVLIVIYVIMKMFTTNPLEGNWADEDGNLNLSIRDDGQLVVTVPELADTADVEVKMNYTLDKDAKMVTIEMDESELQKTVEQSGGQYTAEELQNAIDPVITTFDYSVDQEQLTLTEREYGEQMVLNRE